MTTTTTTRRGSSFRLWNARLDGDTLTRGQIRQFCNAIAPGYHGYYIGGNRTNLTPEDCRDLARKFSAHVHAYGGYKLEPEHTQFGLDWLRKDPKRAESLGITADMLDTFQGFRFVGWRIVRVNGLGLRALIVPIYRVLYGIGISSGNRPGKHSHDYFWSPWTQRAYEGV